MHHSVFLRTQGCRVVGWKRDLLSVSFAWRRFKKRQREDTCWNARKGEAGARQVERFRKMRVSGALDRLRAQGLGDVADGYERDMAGVD
jgi:hypothetical protein